MAVEQLPLMLRQQQSLNRFLQALYDFEEVIAMENRQPSTPREFSLVSSLFRVAHYNIACCYAAIDQVHPFAGQQAVY